MAKGSIALLCACVALLGACATREQIDAAVTADYGMPPPADVWHRNVKAWFDNTLKDPESAQYKMGCPVKGYMQRAVFDGPGMEFVGYMALVEVNAKNSYGGYTGYESYFAFLQQDGRIFSIQRTLSGGGWNHPRLTVVEHQSCEVPERVKLPPA